MPVVASIKIDSFGLPCDHVVAITVSDDHLFNVHTAQLIDDFWEAYHGAYRLPWERALTEAFDRARFMPPQQTPAENTTTVRR